MPGLKGSLNLGTASLVSVLSSRRPHLQARHNLSTQPINPIDHTQKLRGAFFTPPEIARFMSDWAVREVGDKVLEPSCGEAAFLLTAAERLSELGARPSAIKAQLCGQDLHGPSVSVAAELLRSRGLEATLVVGDFFSTEALPHFDAVVGNPPYVRYQQFSGAARTVSLEAALRQGVRLNQLASSWAAFTVHASAFLKPTGRMALVLPAELMTVNYAAQIRRFLLDRFSKVRLVVFDSLVFPGILEEVVLVLAEGHGGAECFELYQAKNASELTELATAKWTEYRPKGGDKWTRALFENEASEIYDEVSAGENFESLRDWGNISLGIVTGNNKYFALSRADVDRIGLSVKEVVRISPPGSKHLKATSFSAYAWGKLSEKNERCYLFAPSIHPSKQALKYISWGEKQDFHRSFKCQIRDPWWQVAVGRRPDFFVPYMNYDRLRIVKNSANVQALNSLYRLAIHERRQNVGADLLGIAALNSFSQLGAEIVGRAYGGGILKHEPREADRLPMPGVELIQVLKRALASKACNLAEQIRSNNSDSILEAVDNILLKGHLGWSESKLAAVKQARDEFRRRRFSRRKEH